MDSSFLSLREVKICLLKNLLDTSESISIDRQKNFTKFSVFWTFVELSRRIFRNLTKKSMTEILRNFKILLTESCFKEAWSPPHTHTTTSLSLYFSLFLYKLYPQMKVISNFICKSCSYKVAPTLGAQSLGESRVWERAFFESFSVVWAS